MAQTLKTSGFQDSLLRVPLTKGNRQGGVWITGANGRDPSAYGTSPIALWAWAKA